MTAPDPSSHGFNPRLIAAIVMVGSVAFIALWALIALGPALDNGNARGGHALSKSATGFAAIVDLLERSGADVSLRRTEQPPRGDRDHLVVLTPAHNSKSADVDRIIAEQRGAPILIILPKWRAGPHPDKSGWVGAGHTRLPPATLVPARHFGTVRIANAKWANENARGRVAGRAIELIDPAQLHSMSGDGFHTLIAAADGSAILARADDRDLYVLTDPDLVNNLGFGTIQNARIAAQLIDAIAEDAAADGIAFDLTLNGFGNQRSLLRFAFVPPFIGITLCLIAAGLLALRQAWIRFGPALKPQRAIPVSKAALIANSADLIQQAGRERDGADAFVHSQRSAIARRLHAPPAMDAAATDGWIDKHLPADSPTFSSLARRLPLARSTHEFLADAQALHDIRKDLLRDT